MSKVKITGVDIVERRIKDMFSKVRKSKAMRVEIGEFVVNRVRAEARRGKPLNDARFFPSLKGSTVKRREKLSRINSTHPTFKASRANITFTGQLVNALTYRLDAEGIFIEVADTARKKIKLLKGGDSEEVLTNQELNEFLRQLGFEFYTASGIERETKILNRINNIVKRYVRRAIKLNFK